MSNRKKKSLTRDEALEKLRHYCAYQDRCHQEVRYKLISLEVYGEDLEQIMTLLVEEGFLDEERYAKAFARGKLRNNHWGIHKIRHGLKQKGISDYNIRQAESELESEDYHGILKKLLRKKLELSSPGSPFDVRQKLFQYAYRKGFDANEINAVLNEILDRQ